MSKLETIEKMLQEGLVQIGVDARKPGVQLPSHLLGTPLVALNLSYKFGVPIIIRPNDTLCVQLTFNGEPFECVLPSEAIWFARGKERSFMFSETSPIPLPPPSPELLKPKLELKVVVSNSEDEVELSPPRTGHLRIVK